MDSLLLLIACYHFYFSLVVITFTMMLMPTNLTSNLTSIPISILTPIPAPTPTPKDYWERFLGSLKEMQSKRQRTVYRLTLVKSWNMDEVRCHTI